MSAEATIIFFGVRREMPEDEMESFEDRSHPLFSIARRSNLDLYYGNFGGAGEKYLLFIGRKIAIIGTENLHQRILTPDRLNALITETVDQLEQAGVEGEKLLHIEWLPDDE